MKNNTKTVNDQIINILITMLRQTRKSLNCHQSYEKTIRVQRVNIQQENPMPPTRSSLNMQLGKAVKC